MNRKHALWLLFIAAAGALWFLDPDLFISVGDWIIDTSPAGQLRFLLLGY